VALAAAVAAATPRCVCSGKADALVLQLVLQKGQPLLEHPVLKGHRGPDGGVNLLFTSNWYKHDVLPVREHGGISEPTIMYGPLCMNIDVVRESVMFPPVRPGDAVVFRNVGAYNVTQWMQFIQYRPAIVMIDENSSVKLIRRAENLDDINRIEHC
jgi:hypothetical protein